MINKRSGIFLIRDVTGGSHVGAQAPTVGGVVGEVVVVNIAQRVLGWRAIIKVHFLFIADIIFFYLFFFWIENS